MDAKTKFPVIDIMESQKKVTKMGGTMRLGTYKCSVLKGTKASLAYSKKKIEERHRHRYEFNNKFLKRFERAGMVFSGVNPKSKLVEIVELTDHPWFVGVQFHPEYRSTVQNPHPLFTAFIKASLENKESNRAQ